MRNYINKINLSFLTCITCIAVIFSSCQPELCRGVDLNSPDGLECDKSTSSDKFVGVWMMQIQYSSESYLITINNTSTSGIVEMESSFGIFDTSNPIQAKFKINDYNSASLISPIYFGFIDIEMYDAVFKINGNNCELSYTIKNNYSYTDDYYTDKGVKQ